MPTPAPRPTRVLVADDDDSIVQMLATLLRSWGLEPVATHDGTSALRALVGENPPPVAVLDWMMPGTSGIDIARCIDNERVAGRRSVPRVLLLTARGGGRDLAEALAAGADDYVVKPFDPVVLRARIEATIRRAGVAAPLEVGSVLDGRYRLDERVGSGGMGSVYRATHLTLGTTVAIKIIREGRPDLPQLRERFEREARTAASVRSRHVAQILDYGVSPGGRPYLVMELLRGQTLEDRLTRLGPLDVDEAVKVVSSIAEGLEAAHEAGLVHRDVKPGNVFLAEEDGRAVAKLIDFGLAKDTAPDAPTMTGHGEVIGTVGFMSPGQLLGETASRECDLWALAATGYAALTGRSPFEAEIQSVTILNTLQGTVPQMNLLRDGLPRELDAWAAAAFARDPSRRFASATELAFAFAVAARSRSCFSGGRSHPST